VLKPAIICLLIFFILICGCTSTTPEKPGSIQVTSTPSGAEVYLDNEYRGTTPNTINNVGTGHHTIELRFHDYQNWFTTIEVAGNSISVSGSLLPIPQPTIIPTPSPVQTTAPAPAPTIIATPVPTSVLENKSSDPILHRWVRQYQVSPSPEYVGYEFIFYSDGSVVYNSGEASMISSNIKIKSTFQASGTWTNVGNGKYIVKVNPVLVGGAPIIREYTRVVTYEDPRYPGKIINEHLESSYEREAFEKNPYQRGDNMPWLERAKID
jgi:hypothetical protein